MEISDYLIIGSGVLAILYGLFASRCILASGKGTERMQEIARAIQEGARAYLNRQYQAIGLVGIVVAVLLGFWLGHHVAIGFILGAILSVIIGSVLGALSGFIGLS